MWGKPTEAEKLIALRRAALEAFRCQDWFKRDIRLLLKLHVCIPEWDTLGTDARCQALQKLGDLDNFVSGVCDGLMGLGKYPHPSQKLAEVFRENKDVHPLKAIAYEDDSQIMEIYAKRMVNRDPKEECWYEVTLEEPNP